MPGLQGDTCSSCSLVRYGGCPKWGSTFGGCPYTESPLFGVYIRPLFGVYTRPPKPWNPYMPRHTTWNQGPILQTRHKRGTHAMIENKLSRQWCHGLSGFAFFFLGGVPEIAHTHHDKRALPVVPAIAAVACIWFLFWRVLPWNPHSLNQDWARSF